MRVYEFAASPNCRKVRAVAYELGLKLEFIPANPFNGELKKTDYLAKNPNGAIPMLEDDDGFVLWESNAIIGYLAMKKSAEPATTTTTTATTTSLVPTNPRQRADVDRWLSWQLAHLGPAIRKVAFERVVKPMSGQGAPDPAIVEAGTADFKKQTAVLEASLGDKEYVAGRLSIADFALASHYSVVEAAGLDLVGFPKTKAWLDRMLARESMKRALLDAQASMTAAATRS